MLVKPEELKTMLDKYDISRYISSPNKFEDLVEAKEFVKKVKFVFEALYGLSSVVEKIYEEPKGEGWFVRLDIYTPILTRIKANEN